MVDAVQLDGHYVRNVGDIGWEATDYAWIWATLQR